MRPAAPRLAARALPLAPRDREEAARLARFFGGESRLFGPSDLPLPDRVARDDHPAAREPPALSVWSGGRIRRGSERHGRITGAMTAPIDHLPLEVDGVRPTQGPILAMTQASGSSQPFAAVRMLRRLGRRMRMVFVPDQSSAPTAFQEVDEGGRMRPSPCCDRIVDGVEAPTRFTVLIRPHAAALVDRHAGRKAAADEARPDLAAIATARQHGDLLR